MKDRPEEGPPPPLRQGAPSRRLTAPRRQRPPARARPRHSSQNLTLIQQVSVQTRCQAGCERARPISSRLSESRKGAAGPFHARLRGAHAAPRLPPLPARHRCPPARSGRACSPRLSAPSPASPGARGAQAAEAARSNSAAL